MQTTTVLAMFGMPGGFEYIIILVVALLVFGRRLPEIMRGLGGSVREFRKGIEDGYDTTEQPKNAEQPKDAEQPAVAREDDAPATAERDRQL